jgi:type IV pilus assembly protein PilB
MLSPARIREMDPAQPVPLRADIDSVLDLVPEPVARENLIMPLSESEDALLVAAAVPIRTEAVELLRFILNRTILIVPRSKEWIEEQLDMNYGRR